MVELDKLQRLSLAQEIITEFRRMETELAVTRSQLSALLEERADLVRQLQSIRNSLVSSTIDADVTYARGK